MEKLLVAYQQYLHRNKLQENTAMAYYGDALHFFEFVKENGISDFAEVTSDTISSYIDNLFYEGKAKATVARCIVSIKRLFGFLLSEKAVNFNPADAIKPPKQKKELPEILTTEEIFQLLEQPAGVDPKAVRDKAMLELLYATGIRVSELIAMNVNDANTGIGYVRCKKRGEERIVPIGRLALNAMDNYLNIVRPSLSLPEEEALFVNMTGRRMTRQGFWKIVKQYAEHAGIDKQITPHTLRHSFAAHLVENGADLHSLQTMLGHAALSSTKVYEKVMNRRLRHVYEKAHPRA